jgi:HD-GYP domain-containing protein (c-di-GMP phosphodiesterase class II)
MAVVVGAELGFDEAELRRLRCAGLLHDIGKIGVPQPVLHKNAALSPGDAARMADHTIIGERIVSQAEYLRPVAPLVRASHERWDGHGYPDGLAGEEIPLASRIVFVCDAFHAMTSDRPYRRALPVTEALDELQAQAGRQFDPRVVDAFVRVLPRLIAEPEPARAT